MMGIRRFASRSIWVLSLLVLLGLLPAVASAADGPEPSSSPSPSPSSSPAEPAPTTLSASSSPTVFRYGSATEVKVSGTISVPAATVTLAGKAVNGADWTEVGAVVAADDGSFAFAAQPAPGSTTEYRVSFAGDAEHAEATAIVRVRVRPRVYLSSARTVWIPPGGTFRLSGRVEPAHPGGTVLIDRRLNDGTWIQVASTTLGADSRFSFSWAPRRFGTVRLRARMAFDADHASGFSAPRKVVINRKNKHMVPHKYAHYIVIVRHEYKLYYYERGKMVRSFRVALGRPGYPTPIGLYSIYHKRRPGGGAAMGSCAMFYRRAGGIAIHGTNQPYLLKRFPRRFSHGCARMYNSEALWLYYRCPKGTPVRNFR